MYMFWVPLAGPPASARPRRGRARANSRGGAAARGRTVSALLAGDQRTATRVVGSGQVVNAAAENAHLHARSACGPRRPASRRPAC